MQNNIDNAYALGLLKAHFGELVIDASEPFGLLTIEVPAANAHEVVEWLKNHAELKVNYLTNIGAVHYPEDAGRELAVVYHLHSLTNNLRIRVKAFLSIEHPEIKSLVDIFVGANWMERETFDFYGVVFIGHPNMTRILNEDSMDYFPLRKEYHLEDATREDKDDRFFGR